jgi:hypothetical protein
MKRTLGAIAITLPMILTSTAGLATSMHLMRTNGKAGDPCAAGRGSLAPNGLCVQWIGDSSGTVKYGTPAVLYLTNKYGRETVNGKADLGKDAPSWPINGGAIYYGWVSNDPRTPPYSTAGDYFSTYFDVGGSTNLCSFELSGQDLYNAEKNNKTVRFIVSKHGDTYSCKQQ